MEPYDDIATDKELPVKPANDTSCGYSTGNTSFRAESMAAGRGQVTLFVVRHSRGGEWRVGGCWASSGTVAQAAARI